MRFRAALLIACAELIVSISGNLSASAGPRRVVLLYDERVELPGLSAMDAEIARTLRSNAVEPIEVYRENMDLSRVGSASYHVVLRDFLHAKYADKKIDAAVAVMAPALDFLLKFGEAIFPSSQIVFCGLDGRQLGHRSLPPNVHGVLIKREFAPTLELVLRLHPKTENVVVVSGTSDFDLSLLADAKKELNAFEDRVSIKYLSELPLNDLLDKLSRLPDTTIILFTTLFRDGAGQAFVPHEIVARVSAAANVPVYGFLDQYLGHGIVGGSLYGLTQVGSETAKLILQLLAGNEPSRSLRDVASNKVLFDWRQMQRWGISESRLPPGAGIGFRDPTAWDQYRSQILLICSVVLTQAALITVLLYERRRRHLAEVQARVRTAELARASRFSTAGELTALIAHELNQPLGSILTNAETMELILNSRTPDIDEIRQIAADIRRDDKRASEVIVRLRSMLKKAPFELKLIDLNEIVRDGAEFLSALAVARQVNLRSFVAPVPLPVKGDRVQLQQVVVNLIVNAMDAMSAMPSIERNVTLTARRNDKFAEVMVSDTGPGIPSEKIKEVFEPFFTTKREGMGMGLSIARTIVEAHSGRMSLESKPGAGAIFRVRLPLSGA